MYEAEMHSIALEQLQYKACSNFEASQNASADVVALVRTLFMGKRGEEPGVVVQQAYVLGVVAVHGGDLPELPPASQAEGLL